MVTDWPVSVFKERNAPPDGAPVAMTEVCAGGSVVPPPERGRKADGDVASGVFEGWTVGDRGKKTPGGGALAGSILALAGSRSAIGAVTGDSGKKAV